MRNDAQDADGSTQMDIGATEGRPEDRCKAGRLCLLGRFDLSLDRPTSLPASAQRVLALLALYGPIDRHATFGRLWPDVDDGRAAACLRTVLSTLNRLCPAVVVGRGPALSLSGNITVDVHDLRRIGTHAIAGAESTIDSSLRLLELGDELLPHVDEDWLVVEREQLRQLRLHALEACAEALCKAGQYGIAMLMAYEAIRVDPLRESAHRLVIAAHLAEGNRAQALTAAERFTAELWSECHMYPSPLVDNLVGSIRSPRAHGARRADIARRGRTIDPSTSGDALTQR